MIYSKLFEASVEDSIQTPGDTGVDLDQIEDNIMGDDGIEAHRDEVEAAQDGMIDDPIDEFSMIVYESEYTYNQIMQAIGVAELNETAMGREVIYEAGNIKAFFAKIKQWLLDLFKRITNAVKKILEKFRFRANADKKFVKEYKNDILVGGKTGKWSYEGYMFGNLKFSGYAKTNDTADKVRSVLDRLKKEDVDGEAVNAELAAALFKDKKTAAAANYHLFGLEDAETNEDFKKRLKDKLFGQKQELGKKDKISPQSIIDILSGDDEEKLIDDAYKNVKNGIKKNLDRIKQWEAKVGGDSKSITAAATACSMGCRYIKGEEEVMQIAHGVFISAAKAKRDQARKIAHLMKEARKKDDSKAKNESAAFGDSIFSNVSFL